MTCVTTFIAILGIVFPQHLDTFAGFIHKPALFILDSIATRRRLSTMNATSPHSVMSLHADGGRDHRREMSTAKTILKATL